MDFYLGTHRPYWLPISKYPLFVSHRTLAPYKKLPVAVTRWALDSGGFTEIKMNGAWTTPPDEYIRAVRRYKNECGLLDWAAPQDWMCEPFMIDKTGLSVVRHQIRTVENYAYLTEHAPDLPFIPVVQGWDIDDFHRCVDMYAEWGFDLTKLERVGVGSVCRRQHTDEIGEIFSSLLERGIQAHGFGVKKQGVLKYGNLLASADSMAWSLDARLLKTGRLDGCVHKGPCQNCFRYAVEWRADLMRKYRAAHD